MKESKKLKFSEKFWKFIKKFIKISFIILISIIVLWFIYLNFGWKKRCEQWDCTFTQQTLGHYFSFLEKEKAKAWTYKKLFTKELDLNNDNNISIAEISQVFGSETWYESMEMEWEKELYKNMYLKSFKDDCYIFAVNLNNLKLSNLRKDVYYINNDNILRKNIYKWWKCEEWTSCHLVLIEKWLLYEDEEYSCE